MNTKHTTEIESTRIGGFGSSDAKLIYKIGLKGIDSLSNTDKRRIAVAKGMIPYKPVKQTDAMQRGHDFEDWYAKQPFAPLNRETYIKKEIAKNFATFAHADFADTDSGEVWELKCLQSPDKAADEYSTQIQWYYMLGTQTVWLVIADSSLPFDAGCRMPVIIPRNEQMIMTLTHGIKLLDAAWDTIDLSMGDDLTTDELLPFEQMEVTALTNYLMEIKQLEAQAEERKQKVLDFMEENGIKSLTSENYSITYIPATTAATFDKKKLLKDHPEIKESDYIKVSEKKSYIKVTLR